MLTRIQQGILGFGMFGSIAILVLKFVQFERWSTALIMALLSLIILFWYLFASNRITRVDEWSGTIQWVLQSCMFGVYIATIIFIATIRENEGLDDQIVLAATAGIASVVVYGFILLPRTYWRESFDDDVRFSVGL